MNILNQNKDTIKPILKRILLQIIYKYGIDYNTDTNELKIKYSISYTTLIRKNFVAICDFLLKVEFDDDVVLFSTIIHSIDERISITPVFLFLLHSIGIGSRLFISK